MKNKDKPLGHHNVPLSDYAKSFFRVNTDVTFSTPRSLWDKGIVLCDKCGKLESIDFKFCKKCKQDIFVIVKKWETETDLELEIWLKNKIQPGSEE